MKKYIITILIAIIIQSVLGSFLDYNRLKSGKNPVLSLCLKRVKDGGTKVYYGFLYQIIQWNVLYEQDGIPGQIRGAEIHIFPFYNYKTVFHKDSGDYFFNPLIKVGKNGCE